MQDITLPETDARGAIVLLSGERRAGKTTLLLAVRAAAQAAGLTVGGMLSTARFEGSEKVGIDVMDAGSGERHALAVYTPEPHGLIHVGRYTFDAVGLAVGLAYARAGQATDLFIVDELGPLELSRGEGWAPVLPLICARRFGAALVVVRPSLLDAARAALDLPVDAPVIELTPDTQASWTDRLAAWIAVRGRG